MRRVSRIIVALSVSLLVGSLAEAGEQLVMPFDCSIDQGRLKISPAAEKSYRIIGRRDEQALTSCGFSPSRGCRTLTAHRFDISCGGSRVSWMRVVGAMGKRATLRPRIKDGRLAVELPLGDLPNNQQECFDRPSGLGVGTGQGRRGVTAANACLPRRDNARLDKMVLPVGSAPLSELGARLISKPPAASDRSDIVAETARASDDASLMPVVIRSGEVIVAKAYPDPSWKPLPDPVTREAGLAPTDVSGSDWVTVVRSGDDVRAEASVSSALRAGSLAWLLVAMIVATLTVIFRARRSPASAVRAAAISPELPVFLARLGLIELRAGRYDGALHRNLTSAGLAVAAVLDHAESEVAQLKDAGPLREVLLSELAHVDRRLKNVDAAAAKGQEIGGKSAPQFRVLVRDLERIRRIAASASASFTCSRDSTILPKTASEAYDVLGVNPDVSEDVLKKIADALRMSWHPDHARDDEDRRVREGRIRQINVACDLISQNRG